VAAGALRANHGDRARDGGEDTQRDVQREDCQEKGSPEGTVIPATVVMPPLILLRVGYEISAAASDCKSGRAFLRDFLAARTLARNLLRAAWSSRVTRAHS